MTTLSIPEKRCLGCRRLKPLGEYDSDKRRSDGLKSRCKVCTAQYRSHLHSANVTEQLCPVCNKVKPVGEFVKNRGKPSLRATYCLDCSAEKSRQHRLTEKGHANTARTKAKRLWADPVRKERSRHMRLLRQYGITLEEFNALLAAQGYQCAICGAELDGGPDTHLDHAHALSGSVSIRAILCSFCNRGLGAFRDNPDILIKAAQYLLKHRQLKLVV